jgi:hypothetical protein
VFFVPLENLSEVLRRKAEQSVAHRRGSALGWCSAFSRGVTYYVGTCPKFLHKRETLLRWVKRL